MSIWTLCPIPLYIQWRLPFPSITMTDACIRHQNRKDQSEWTVNVLQCHTLIVIRQCHLCKAFSTQNSICPLTVEALKCTQSIVLATAVPLCSFSSPFLSLSLSTSFVFIVHLSCCLHLQSQLSQLFFLSHSVFLCILLLLHYSKVRQIQLLSRIDVTTQGDTSATRHIFTKVREWEQIKRNKGHRKKLHNLYESCIKDQQKPECSMLPQWREKCQYDCAPVCLCKPGKH